MDPYPPWEAIASACASTVACGSHSSTWTFAGNAPSSAGTPAPPKVTSTRASSAASESIAFR
jgi:hypothetical protein